MTPLKRKDDGRPDVTGWSIPSLDKVKDAVTDAYHEVLSETIEMLLSSDDMIAHLGPGEDCDELTVVFSDLNENGGDLAFAASLTEIVENAISYHVDTEEEPQGLIPLRNLLTKLTESVEKAISDN